MSNTVLNLMQRIVQIRKAVTYIQKDKSVSTGGGSYKAVTHDAVTGMLRQHMDTFGVVSWPVLVASRSIPKEEGSKQFRYEATYDFIFCSSDNPADQITIRIEAHAMDNADKAPGKALSYAKKYAMLKLFEIETGEDEESRYQEFDVTPLLDAMHKSATMEELKVAFEEAEKIAKSQKDQSILKAVVTVKNNTGKKILAKTPRTEAEFQKALEAIRDGKYTVQQLKERAMTDAQTKTLELFVGE